MGVALKDRAAAAAMRAENGKAYKGIATNGGEVELFGRSRFAHLTNGPDTELTGTRFQPLNLPLMMYRSPTPLKLSLSDEEFLVDVARKVLGTSSVAATNARTIGTVYRLDPKRVDALIPWGNAVVELGGFVFKKVEPDPETPDNYGLFVRIKG